MCETLLAVTPLQQRPKESIDMPPLPIIADTYRVTLNWENTNGQHAANVIHIYAPGKDIPTVLDKVDDSVTANMWDATSASGQVVSLDCIKLDGTSSTQTKSSLNNDGRWQGNASGQPIPQSCAMVKFATGHRGREYRGRIFLPWVAEDVQNGGMLSTAVRDSINLDWVAFVNGTLVPDYNLVVASYKLHQQHAVLGVAAELATGTQRRRQQRNR
jgi:hypothetical protein